MYFNWYFARIVSIWNSLPPDIKCLDLSENENNKHFKRELMNYYNDELESHLIVIIYAPGLPNVAVHFAGLSSCSGILYF